MLGAQRSPGRTSHQPAARPQRPDMFRYEASVTRLPKSGAYLVICQVSVRGSGYIRKMIPDRDWLRMGLFRPDESYALTWSPRGPHRSPSCWIFQQPHRREAIELSERPNPQRQRHNNKNRHSALHHPVEVEMVNLMDREITKRWIQTILVPNNLIKKPFYHHGFVIEDVS